MRHIFDVYIQRRTYGVYRLDIEHQSYNGGPANWWLWYSDEPATVDGLHWEPYEDVLIPRLSWSISYEQNTYSKVKWDSHHFYQTGEAKMFCNGKEVYSFRSRDLNYALARFAVLQVELIEHPYNFLTPEESRGMKIWYHGFPATIEPSSQAGEITIVPDTDDVEAWWSDYIDYQAKLSSEPDIDRDYNLEWKHYGKINHGDALSDGCIRWFRK